MTSDLTKDEGENHVTELCLQIYKEHLGLSEAEARKEASSPEASMRTKPCQHLVFRLLTSRTVREHVCIALSHLSCDTLLWYP